jgi:hypothetical protein
MYIVDLRTIHFVDCVCPTTSRLTRRANQRHFDMIEEDYTARAEIGSGLSHW